MPLTTEQILKSLKIEGKTFETEEDFVSEFSKHWNAVGAPVDDETKTRITGGLIGTIETDFKRELKSYGVDFSFDKTKKVQENIAEGVKALNAAKLAEIEELKLKGGEGSDDKVKTLTTDLEKWKNKYHEEKTARETAVNEFQTKSQELEGKIKNVKKDYKVTDVFASSVKWKAGITDVEKRGFDTIFKSKYEIDLDEQDNLVITDKQGKQIPNPKVAGTFLGVAEVLQMEGVANKVWEINPHTQNKPVNQAATTVTTPANGGRTVAPRIIGTSTAL